MMMSSHSLSISDTDLDSVDITIKGSVDNEEAEIEFN